MNIWWSAAALGAVLSLTPVMRHLALHAGLVDRAGGDPLKIHERPVPMAGGCILVPVFIIILAACARQSAAAGPWVWAVINAGLMIFILGLADDLRPLPAGLRLAVQLFAGVIVLFSGIGTGFSFSAAVSAVITVFYIAGAVNAFNVIDGMDGLCATTALFSCAGFFILGTARQDPLLYLCAGILGACLLGFLPYNIHPAKVFLGDSGSGFLGCICGIMAVTASGSQVSPGRFVSVLLILGVPVADMAAAMVRRALRRTPLFKGDRDHLYDLLLKKGMTQSQVWGIMSLLQGVSVFTGLMIGGF